MIHYPAFVKSLKKKAYKTRFYRHWVRAEGFIKTHISVEETDLYVFTDRPFNRKWFRDTILNYRRDIQSYIAKDSRFLTALKPMAVELNAPYIVRKMAEAAFAANVGPMAAVAGTIAQLLGQDLLNKGCREAIIENGGDIFLTKQKKNRLVAVFAGESEFSNRLNLLIRPKQTPCGICTSSATFGHSLSFGSADCAVILADDAAVADAVATATCNLVNSKKDLKNAIKFAKSISGVFAAVIVLGDSLATWGELRLKNRQNRIIFSS